MDKNERTPLLDPIIMLLRSRRFVTAVVTVFVSWLVSTAPGLEGSKDTLITAVVTIGGVVIGGFSLEDFGEAQAKK